MNDKSDERPGLSLELIVAKIQKLMDQGSEVTHNEKLIDRVGNKRQYDVVIRGQFGGRPILGVIECKDHNRRKGPSTVEAFAKKTENLGANLRLIVSRRGFTEQALNLARHENIGCLSLLPDNPEQAGFSIGDTWYGVIDLWTELRLTVFFAKDVTPPTLPAFDANTVKWQGKPVINWFRRELYTTYRDEHAPKTDDAYVLTITFSEPRCIEIEGRDYRISAIACHAKRTKTKKKKWVYWSGDAFYDWHTQEFKIPPTGVIVGSMVETDIREWDDYSGELPDLSGNDRQGFIRAIVYNRNRWDESLNTDTPDLNVL